jgi:hypothetical protein
MEALNVLARDKVSRELVIECPPPTCVTGGRSSGPA